MPDSEVAKRCTAQAGATDCLHDTNTLTDSYGDAQHPLPHGVLVPRHTMKGLRASTGPHDLDNRRYSQFFSAARASQERILLSLVCAATETVFRLSRQSGLGRHSNSEMDIAAQTCRPLLDYQGPVLGDASQISSASVPLFGEQKKCCSENQELSVPRSHPSIVATIRVPS